MFPRLFELLLVLLLVLAIAPARAEMPEPHLAADAAISDDDAATDEWEGILRRYFPQELAAYQDLISHAASEQEEEELRDQFIDQFSTKYARHGAFASDTALAAFISAEIGLYEALLAEDPKLCAASVMGELKTARDSGRFDTQFAAILYAMMGATRSGLDSPIHRRPANSADWDLVGLQMLENGISEDVLSALRFPRADDPKLCVAFIAEMRALNMPGHEIARAGFLSSFWHSD